MNTGHHDLGCPGDLIRTTEVGRDFRKPTTVNPSLKRARHGAGHHVHPGEICVGKRAHARTADVPAPGSLGARDGAARYLSCGDQGPSPILAFLHGGYKRFLDSADSCFMLNASPGLARAWWW
jgi:hypothetical protein